MGVTSTEENDDLPNIKRAIGNLHLSVELVNGRWKGWISFVMSGAGDSNPFPERKLFLLLRFCDIKG
jgi:hypothetical protein